MLFKTDIVNICDLIFVFYVKSYGGISHISMLFKTDSVNICNFIVVFYVKSYGGMHYTLNAPLPVRYTTTALYIYDSILLRREILLEILKAKN